MRSQVTGQLDTVSVREGDSVKKGQRLFSIEDGGYWRKIPPNGLFVLPYIWLCVE